MCAWGITDQHTFHTIHGNATPTQTPCTLPLPTHNLDVDVRRLCRVPMSGGGSRKSSCRRTATVPHEYSAPAPITASKDMPAVESSVKDKKFSESAVRRQRPAKRHARSFSQSAAARGYPHVLPPCGQRDDHDRTPGRKIAAPHVRSHGQEDFQKDLCHIRFQSQSRTKL